MFRPSPMKSLVVAACVATVPAAARAAEPVDADSPKAVAVAFVEAVTKADDATVDALGTGTPQQVADTKAVARMLAAIFAFTKACDAKFGPDNAVSKSMSAAMRDPVGEAKASDYKVEGDVATAVNKDKPGNKTPMKLKRVAGKWKVDLASLGDDQGEVARKAPALVKVFNDAAREVGEGKHHTAEAAALAIQPKVIEASK
jgi:hypothetical protein